MEIPVKSFGASHQRIDPTQKVRGGPMKSLQSLGLSLLVLSSFVACNPVQGQEGKPDPRLTEIAKKVVTVSANVKPGEVVVISGGIQKLPLMQAVAIEVAKVGGRVAPLFVTTDRLERAYLVDVPEQYLGQPWPGNAWLSSIDVWISTSDYDDSKAVLENVPESRIAKNARSAEAYRTALSNSRIRRVYIDVPNKKDAEYAQMDWVVYQNMLWNAINANYQEISDKGDRLAKMLESANSIRITSPSGTDITMALGKRTAFVSAGLLEEHGAAGEPYMARQTSLPGGMVMVAPVETSATGTAVVPKDTCRPYEYLIGATYLFKEGKMTSFTAKANADCFEQDYSAYSGDKDRIASVWIGLNPALKVMESGGNDFRPWEAAGMVIIWMGNNQLLGGTNKTEFGWGIPVTNASVEIDGKTVVKDGQLVF
jgi:leucyl aminopeptidase (aminopeptidase T)